MCPRALQLCFSHLSAERRRRYKRTLSYLVICANFFLGGFEYGVIFPTAMDYLASLGAGAGRETFYFGLLIVVYGVTHIIGGYVGGLWADTVVETRPLLVMAAVPQIIGNAMYFFCTSPGQLVLSRALSGIGSGANTAMIAELTRTTSLRNRTSVISLITFTRQLGIVCGPAVGAFLTGMPDVFKHKITLLNAPGFLLALCYIAYLLFLMLGYSNLTIDEDEREQGGNITAPSAAVEGAVGCPGVGVGVFVRQDNAAPPEAEEAGAREQEVDLVSSTPARPLLLSLPCTAHQPVQSSWPPYQSLGGWRTPASSPQMTPDCFGDGAFYGSRLVLPPVCPHCSKPLISQAAAMPSPVGPAAISVVNEWREILHWPVMVVLITNFAAYLSMCSLEAVLPALVERDLQLPITYTGHIFIFGGAVQCAVLGFVFATPLMPCLVDQKLIVTGLAVMAAAHVHLAVTFAWVRAGANGAPRASLDGSLHGANQSNPAWFWLTLGGSGIQFFGYPLVNSVATSFLSKLLSRGAQGVGAAGLRVSVCAGLMIGPLWGASMLQHHLSLLLVPLVVLVISLVCFFLTERRGGFGARMREAAQVDRVTPRVCATPGRVRTISTLNHVRQVCDQANRDGASVCSADFIGRC